MNERLKRNRSFIIEESIGSRSIEGAETKTQPFVTNTGVVATVKTRKKVNDDPTSVQDSYPPSHTGGRKKSSLSLQS